MSDEQEFDIDAGVDSIAADMGWNDDGDDDNEIVDDLNDNDSHKEQEQEEEAATPDVEDRTPPASWSKDKHEIWSALPQAAQEQIELREKQMLDGIEQYKEGNAYAGEIKQIIAPFKAFFEQHGLNETQAISNLLQHNRALTEGSLEQRQNAFIALGNNLGIIPQDGQAQIDPNTQALQQRIDRIERQENERVQAVQKDNYSRVAQEVADFAKDKEDFDLLGDDITLILKSGVDLATAYEKARWANPVTRAKALAESVEAQTKVISKKNTDAARVAQKAKSTNIRHTNTNKTPSEPKGALFDDMGDMLAEIRARS
ncbi:MAG: hypothetical protein M0R47_21130 [Methylobacter sp.]|uniref:hypothetical protein n=1 Tax=Methylobacter sp. TaxID=2051955 RepID=UPI0025FC2C2E|nr:hypothetical protein [Methylobacter sp.]MCK9623027.1 hypothetical protein [Methylobacter sp.]